MVEWLNLRPPLLDSASLQNKYMSGLCFIDYAKAFDYVDHNKLCKAVRNGNTRPRTHLLRNLYACRSRGNWILYGTTGWFRVEKGVWQGCLLSPCLFNLYSEHIMRSAGLDESQAGIETGGRNNNLRYVDDTTLTAESEEELKSLLKTERGEWKGWLKAQHSKN